MKPARLQLTLLGLLLVWALASQVSYSWLELILESESGAHVEVPFRLYEASKTLESVSPVYSG